jgi:hypothetical protein
LPDLKSSVNRTGFPSKPLDFLVLKQSEPEAGELWRRWSSRSQVAEGVFGQNPRIFWTKIKKNFLQPICLDNLAQVSSKNWFLLKAPDFLALKLDFDNQLFYCKPWKILHRFCSIN